MSIRSYLSATALKTLTLWHGSVRVASFGVRRSIPLRGALATGLLNSAARQRTWKSAIFRLFRVGKDALFIDVGTSVGQTLLEFRAVMADARYLGVDPNPAVIAYLNTLITANALLHCQTFCFAASDSAGPALLNIDSDETTNTGATLIADLRPAHDSIALGVATLPLDSILPFVGDATIALVKIDVEGAELFALRGMARILTEHRPIIICEVLFPDRAADARIIVARNVALAALLVSHDYRIYQIIKHGEADQAPTFTAIDHFPLGVYSPATAALCDYVFVPKERDLALP